MFGGLALNSSLKAHITSSAKELKKSEGQELDVDEHFVKA